MDDENLDLKGIKKLILWEELGLILKGTFSDAFSALEYLEDHPIDILISDIKMPIMTGLELGKKAIERQNDLEVVFLSGYQNFDYAKKAIDISACGYVLKPVDKMELTQVLQNTVRRIDLKRKQRRKEKQYEGSLPYLRNDLIVRWIKGKTSFETTKKFLGAQLSINPGQTYRTVVIELDDVNWRLNSFSQEDKQHMIKDIMEVIVNKLEQLTYGSVCGVENFHVVLFTEQDDGFLFNHLNELIRDISEMYPLSISVGMGDRVQHIDEINHSYDHAIEALSLKMFNGKGKILHKDRKQEKNMKQNKKHLEWLFDRLFEAVSSYNLINIFDLLEKVFQFAATLRDKMSVYHFTLHLVSKLNEYLHSQEDDLYHLLNWEYRSMDKLFQLETIGDIESWIRKIMFEVSEKMMIQGKEKYPLLKVIDRYVSEHIENYITLKEVADFSSMSPNYLGTLFKELSGEHFSDYMIRKKMEHVKELLKDPTIKVYEVAERLGYRNLTHFHKVFKEHFGLSPGDYRKMKVR